MEDFQTCRADKYFNSRMLFLWREAPSFVATLIVCATRIILVASKQKGHELG